MKALRLQSALGSLLRPKIALPVAQARWQHSATRPPLVPPAIPFVPDVQTFLTVIGRGLSQHAAKFPSWEALFTLTSDQLRELGVEPPRTRRYLLRWRQRFREGKFGIGGDLRHVENGTAELKVLEVEKDPITRLRYVVNVPPGGNVQDVPQEDLARVAGFHVDRVRTITGPYALPARGGGARISVTEGMWEDRRGHKVDGGERRRAEVRFKKRALERRALKEKQGFY